MRPRDKLTLVLSLIDERDRGILEIGCGEGEMARHLSSLGKSIVGVERDAVKASAAKEFCKEVIVGDIEAWTTIESLKSFEKSYDLILYSEVLEHLVSPEQTLRELRIFLRPGGGVLAVLPNVAFYKTRLMLLGGRWNYSDEGILDRTHLRFFTRYTAETLIRDAGFQIVANLATHYSRRYVFLYNRLVERWPGLFGEQFVIRAEKIADSMA